MVVVVVWTDAPVSRAPEWSRLCCRRNTLRRGDCNGGDDEQAAADHAHHATPLGSQIPSLNGKEIQDLGLRQRSGMTPEVRAERLPERNLRVLRSRKGHPRHGRSSRSRW